MTATSIDSTTANNTISAEELDELFDSGADVSKYMDYDNAEVVDPEPRDDSQWQVSITLPKWLVDFMDDEAQRRCVSRKAVINDWLVDRADLEIERRKKRA